MLLNEDELTKNWADWDSSNPVVSVICCTYNQAQYLESALTGFFSQRTEFPFEVIVQNDASTDDTKSLIDEWFEKYPNILKPYHHDENQFSKGNKPGAIAIGRSRGEYIALCEGDDYWTDTFKLQKQVRALQDNPSVGLCFHPAAVMKEAEKIRNRNFYSTAKCIVSAEAVIKGRGAFMPTASLLIRKSDLIPLPNWLNRYAPVGDTFFQAIACREGGALFLPECMSAYRMFSNGSISSGNRLRLRSSAEIRRRYNGYIESYRGLALMSSNDLTVAIDHAKAISCFECLVDAIRAQESSLCKDIAEGINLQALSSGYRSFIVRLSKFAIFLGPLAHLLKLKRSLQPT